MICHIKKGELDGCFCFYPWQSFVAHVQNTSIPCLNTGIYSGEICFWLGNYTDVNGCLWCIVLYKNEIGFIARRHVKVET